MPPIRASLVPALAGFVFVTGAAMAQEASLDQIHPRTSIVLGFAFGDQDVENNTGDVDVGIISRSTDAYHIRLRGEHFFESDFGFLVDGYYGIADDLNEKFGSTDSSFDSFGIFLAASYRATMGERFRLPVRFGPFLQSSKEDDSLQPDGAIERSVVGVKLSAEPEVVLSRSVSNGKVAELSAFADFGCGAGPAKVKDDVDDEDAYAFTLNWEVGFRYRFTSGLLAGVSWYAQKNHIGTTESYNNAVFFGVDDDFTGVMITAGLRF